MRGLGLGERVSVSSVGEGFGCRVLSKVGVRIQDQTRSATS